MSDPPLIEIPAAVRRAIRRHLAAWYAAAKRDLPWRRSRDPYAIWVSEVMLQQTQVKTVIPYYRRFIARFPGIRQLAAADEQTVLKAWEGLGYYARARNLQKAARWVATRMAGRVPSDWPAMRQLPGAGDYITAAVLSIAYDQPYAVVDGNVKRVLARLFAIETPVNQASGHKVYQAAADRLLDRRHPGRHNQAVMELGALVCLARKPLCDACPVGTYCRAFREGRTDHYPLRTKRAATPRRRQVAGVVVKKGRLLLVQRPAEGLLAGLWEFPCGPVMAGETPQGACGRCIDALTGLQVAVGPRVVTVHHTYTHFKLQLEVYLCDWPPVLLVSSA